jgi:hypothetical protein
MSLVPTIRPVASRRDLRRFVAFPYDLYRDNPYWIPTLRSEVYKVFNPKKNAFFEHGSIQPFLALDGEDRVVGTIAAIINGMHLKKYGDATGFFGFFECTEDPVVARALLETAEGWLREKGMTAVRGPANPSLNDTAGLLVDGFDREPSVLMPYNPPYYERFLEENGYSRAMTMWAYYLHKKYVRLEKIRRGVEIVRRRHPDMRVRTIDMSRFEEEARTILDIYNDAWSQNWGHVPMTESEFAQLAKDMKQIIDPEIVYILEDGGKDVAFAISLPNINLAMKHVRSGRLLPTGLVQLLGRAKFGGIHEIRMPLMGVRQGHHNRGFDAVVVMETIDRGMAKGYDACEMSWVLDANTVLKNMLVGLGGVVDKEYAMFEKVGSNA